MFKWLFGKTKEEKERLEFLNNLSDDDAAVTFDVINLDLGTYNFLKNDRKTKYLLKKLSKEDGEYVFKGEKIGETCVKGMPSVKADLLTPCNGYFKSFLNPGDRMKPNETVFVILDVEEIPENEVKLRLIDEENIDNLTKKYSYFTSNLNEIDIYSIKDGFNKDIVISYYSSDSLYSENEYILYVKFYYINNQPFLETEFFRKHFQLKCDDKILFLFDDGEVIEIKISTDSVRIRKDSEGVIYGVKEKITEKELYKFSKALIQKWRVQVNSKNQTFSGEINRYFLNYIFDSRKRILDKINCLIDLKKRV